MNSTQMMQWGGMPVIRLNAGGYTALIAHEIGSNVIRLRDEKNGMEIFRFDNSNTADVIRQSAEVWGLPTLYLPNRFADGILRTSDAEYHLPVNEKEPYNNHIHGFLHKRVHTVVEHNADANCAWAKTAYMYDENDPFFQYMPVRFRAEFTFTLSACGLEYEFKLTNLSHKMMPVSVATHTAFNSPFVDGAKEKDARITVPIGKRCLLNERCLPTCEFADLTMRDLEYRSGSRCPVLQNIDNEMYFAEHMIVDGEDFYGIVCEDTASGKKLCYEVGEEYRFWIIWNDKGFNGYFCPEPMSAMIDAPNLDLPQGMTGYRELKPEESCTFTQHFFTVCE
ncbi:MAG: aldose 1-epimerase [Oscillospiraceae bacterium]|nr:aldose 1-epimerase [Oscillospiraceae bacterium]